MALVITAGSRWTTSSSLPPFPPPRSLFVRVHVYAGFVSASLMQISFGSLAHLLMVVSQRREALRRELASTVELGIQHAKSGPTIDTGDGGSGLTAGPTASDDVMGNYALPLLNQDNAPDVIRAARRRR